MASWWLVPPGWEPDFVTLAPPLLQTWQQLNEFSTYSFKQLQQIADFAVNGLNELSAAFDQERAATAAAIAKLQSQVNELATPKPDVPPLPLLMIWKIESKEYGTLFESYVRLIAVKDVLLKLLNLTPKCLN
ncbi:hypothetical protein DSO57_1000715 [Entomophthora muscae]|uniref:Uncharacterized protein n=1 Tax=Entomophthora muscae TaxID=34485 RepID=A0ACC2SM62_9FUNG|nr:hypothetical protein DSO57_1000715 [Entomophthora muscae]